jgi:hypothetical protein
VYLAKLLAEKGNHSYWYFERKSTWKKPLFLCIWKLLLKNHRRHKDFFNTENIFQWDQRFIPLQPPSCKVRNSSRECGWSGNGFLNDHWGKMLWGMEKPITPCEVPRRFATFAIFA